MYAAEMLRFTLDDVNAGFVDILVLKIRYLFDGALRQASFDGKLNKDLWVLIVDIAKMWLGQPGHAIR